MVTDSLRKGVSRVSRSRWVTRPSQLMADKFATCVFTVTGVGVILTVFGMLFFFLQTVLPLFHSKEAVSLRVEQTASQAVAFKRDLDSPFSVQVTSNAQGECLVTSYSPASSAGAEENAPVPGSQIVIDPAWVESHTPISIPAGARQDSLHCLPLSPSRFLVQVKSSLLALDLNVRRRFLSAEEVGQFSPDQVRDLGQNGWLATPQAFFAQASPVAPVSQLSAQVSVAFALDLLPESSELAGPRVSRALYRSAGDSSLISLLFADHSVRHLLLRTEENMMTGETRLRQMDFYPQSPKSNLFLAASGQALVEVGRGTQMIISDWDSLWDQNPVASIFELRDIEGIQIPDSSFVAAALAFGKNTLLLINEQGRCFAYDVSLAYLQPGRTSLGAKWEETCVPANQAVRLASSPWQRLVLAYTSSGQIHAIDATTGEVVFRRSAPPYQPDDEDFYFTFDVTGHHFQWKVGERLEEFAVRTENLEGTLRRLFLPVQYEGYQDPSFSWQSTSGSDDFEAKFSLWPLIWGTLKATFYAMIFATPLGIFAAVYSSEILDRKTRNYIKPTIELMASLPSVVLGYLAAVILAPWVEANILGVILCGLLLPMLLYFCGNLVSHYSARHVSGRGLYASRRLLFMILVGLVLGFFVMLQLGHVIESLAFSGDLRAFLSGGQGSISVMYGILILPMVLVGLWSLPVGRFRKTWNNIVFIFGPFASLGLGFVMYMIVGESDLSVAGYSQRNALVICIAMGFAIIPIIYSLAEDALTAVPGSLRAGSLACGASVWQTTAKVVLPTAASGIFSAVMVGFGRAIGETMIVVMATGNSPLMSFNPFEGLRTLSANIAVELPEAPKDGTHYRILFFSGLLLFLLTFVLNTAAEAMRSRYRKRNRAL